MLSRDSDGLLQGFRNTGIIILKSGLLDKEKKLNEFTLTKGELASNIFDNVV